MFFRPSTTKQGLNTTVLRISILGILLMMVVFYLIYSQIKHSFIERENREHKALIELVADRWHHELIEMLVRLETVATARALFLSNPTGEAERVYSRKHKTMGENFFRQGLFFVDKDGNILCADFFGNHERFALLTKHLEKNNLLRSDKPQIQSIVMKGYELPLILFIHPVHNARTDLTLEDDAEDNSILEYGVGIIDGTNQYIINEMHSIVFDYANRADLVNENNIVIFSTDQEMVSTTVGYPNLVKQLRSTGRTLIEEDKHENEIILLAMVPHSQWLLTLKYNAEEYYGFIISIRRTLISVVAISFLVIVIFVMVLDKYLIKPILSLSKSAEEISKGRFDVPILSGGTGEIGILADAMEKMRNNIQSLLVKEKERKIELETEVNAKTKRLRLLNEISLYLGQTREIGEIIESTLERTIELLGAHSGAIYLMEEDGETLKLNYSPMSILPQAEQYLNKNEGISGVAIKMRRALALENSNYPSERLNKYFQKEKIKTHAAAPLYSKGKLLGTIAISSRREDVLSREELDYLNSIANVVASAIESALLFRQLSNAKVEWENTFDSMADLIILIDTDHNIIRANMAVYEFFDYTYDEIIGRKYHDLFYNDFRGPDAYFNFLSLFEFTDENKGNTIEIGLKGLDFRVSVFPLKDEEGKVRGFVQVARDITEENKLMKDLEFRINSASLQNELTKSINSTLEIGNIISNLIQGLQKILDFDVVAIIRFLPEEDSFEINNYFDSTGKYEIGKEYKVKSEDMPQMKNAWFNAKNYISGTQLRNSKEKFEVDLSLNGINSYIGLPLVADNKVMAYLGLAHRMEQNFSEKEITLLESLADDLSVAMKNAQLYEGLETAHNDLKSMHMQLLQAEKLSSMGKLSAGTAHEILNPLNIISMYIQIMEMDWNLNESELASIASIMTQIDRIKNIADGLRVFSRQQETKEVETDINHILNETVTLVAHDLKLNNIKIEKNLHPTLPKLMADTNQLTQVFINIMMNARDAMPQGGALTLRTGLTAIDDREMIEIEFEDTGMGIPDDILSKIYDPFFTTKPADKGTGLGLSICYGIIDKMGGKIDVKSKQNEGTNFTIYLPTSMDNF